MAAEGMSRRGALGVVAAGVGGVAALAACGSGAGSGDGTTGNGSGGGGGQGTGAPAPGTTVTALSAVPVGASVVANAGDAPVAVAQPTAGKAVAHSAICTHMGCTVKAAGKQLHCPLSRLAVRRVHRGGGARARAEALARRGCARRRGAGGHRQGVTLAHSLSTSVHPL